MSNKPLINPRDLKFDLEANATRHWFAGDPYKTAFCDAFSLCLPAGERFFIRSIRNYQNQIDDPQLRADMEAFIAQEAYHTREHERYNRILASQGHDVERLERRVKPFFDKINEPLYMLALTCAIEHLTATLSHQILKDPSHFDGAVPAYKMLWIWHAIEETEHKSVAYDVYIAVTKNLPAWKRYLLRVVTFSVMTYHLNNALYKNIKQLLGDEINQKTVPFTLRYLWSLLFQPGFYRRAAPYYLSYLIPGFTPWKIDNSHLLAKWRDKLPTKGEIETMDPIESGARE